MNFLPLEWLMRVVGGCAVIGKKSRAHTGEWINKTLEFIDRAFSVPNNWGVKCPCNRCTIAGLVSCQAMRCG
jgi:hypothetical protein